MSYRQWRGKHELFEKEAVYANFELWNGRALACAQSDGALADAY
jgi:hypothetical protein